MSSTTSAPSQGKSIPSLSSLVRPVHMVSLFRMNEQRKVYYFHQCSQLWEAILAHPAQSTVYQKAFHKLVWLTRTIKDGLIRQREKQLAVDAARREKAQQTTLEQSAFQTLMRQVSGNRPIPAFADFEPGPSVNQNTNQAVTGPVVSDKDAKLAVDDVETALALLDIDVKKTSLEDLHAGLTILDLPEGSHSKVDDYLRSVFCKAK